MADQTRRSESISGVLRASPRRRLALHRTRGARHCAAVLAALLAGLVAWAGGPAAALAQSRSYTIDPQASSVQVRLRRDGVLALLAHDHALAAQGFAGRVSLDPDDLSRASLQVTVPVASLLVDAPAARTAWGLDGQLDEGDRAEIRENMFAADQLDAARFPHIVATLEGVTGTLPDVTLTLRVRIRQSERTLSVPAHVELTAGELRATGELVLLQSAFGIEPYRALLGAIAVDDPVTVRFRIVAREEAT